MFCIIYFDSTRIEKIKSRVKRPVQPPASEVDSSVATVMVTVGVTSMTAEKVEMVELGGIANIGKRDFVTKDPEW